MFLHIAFVFERILAPAPPTVEMRRTLSKKRAIRGSALFRRPISLETFLNDGRVFSMVVCVHLNIRRAYVDFVTAFFDAMVVRLFTVMRTVSIPISAIIQRTISHKSVLQAFVALLMPFEVSDHLLLLDKDAAVAVEAVKVLAVVQVLAVGTAALQGAAELADVFGVVELLLLGG